MNQFSISMPTNLNPLIAPELSNNQNETTATVPTSLPAEPSANASGNNVNYVHCNEVPITFRSQLPSLPHARNTKANLARQVTNVIKRHNIQQITDKII